MEAKKILKKRMPLYALKNDSLPFVQWRPDDLELIEFAIIFTSPEEPETKSAVPAT